jgi:uncharacterized protein (TIGR00304 family)
MYRREYLCGDFIVAEHSWLFTLGIVLILVGTLVLIVTSIMYSRRSSKSEDNKTKIAGVIVVGPVPIIFGNDLKAIKTVITLAIILTVFAIVGTIILYMHLLR